MQVHDAHPASSMCFSTPGRRPTRLSVDSRLGASRLPVQLGASGFCAVAPVRSAISFGGRIFGDLAMTSSHRSALCLVVVLAVSCTARGWELGSGLTYGLTTTVLFREAGIQKPGGDVGFQLTAELFVTAVWRDPDDPDALLLKIELLSPKLWIKSRKAPEPEGFVEHSSRLADISKKPIVALWKNGQVKAVYADTSEDASTLNLKRGLVSLFQYSTLDKEIQERDSSGLCTVAYTSLDSKTIQKKKVSCEKSTLPQSYEHPNPLFGVKLMSFREAKYELNQALLPKIVREEEKHEMTLVARPEVGTIVTSQRVLELLPRTSSVSPLQAESSKDSVVLLDPMFKEISIELQAEPSTCSDAGCPTLEQAVDQNRAALEGSALGTARSAQAFLKLIPLVREASPEELAKLLKSPRYKNVRAQLYDIIGSAATPAAHQAAMKVLRLDEQGDDTERYLWALSTSPMPHPDIVKDILKRSEETMQNDKVSETYALSAAAMAKQQGSPAVVDRARVSLELGLDTCTGEDCRLKFLRALRNLRSKASIPTLLQYAVNGTRATSVAAWRALGALPREHVTTEVKAAAVSAFYQTGGKRRDSSVRTLAVDVILETKPSIEDLQGLVKYLAVQDPAYEVRKYLSQRMEQIAARDSAFAAVLKRAFDAAAKDVYNYNVLALKGLSTAFSRSFLNSAGSNGSLLTVQEVSSGLLKRGVVDVVLESGAHSRTLFSLGLFASGLGGLVSSSGPDEFADDPMEDEVTTAGMEIALLDVGIRPFVFFTSQSELMGHVWSGTASERTPAFQALANLHLHREVVPLASGFAAVVEAEGAVSFDLAGQVQLSLWSRNAQSLVEMGAGVAIRGETKVRSNFVQSTTEFSLTMEPKLELATDVDFSSSVSLCMRLTQPETTVRHHVYKIERIPGSRHKLRKTRRSRLPSPPKSYMLNRKNSDMCSKVFS